MSLLMKWNVRLRAWLVRRQTRHLISKLKVAEPPPPPGVPIEFALMAAQAVRAGCAEGFAHGHEVVLHTGHGKRAVAYWQGYLQGIATAMAVDIGPEAAAQQMRTVLDHFPKPEKFHEVEA